MISIHLKTNLNPEQEKWIYKHIGPKLYHLHNKIGGRGWMIDKGFYPEYGLHLEFEDDQMATMWLLRWPCN